MQRRLTKLGIGAIAVVAIAVWVGAPYARAASLIVRAANFGGTLEALADREAHAITVEPTQSVPTRHGEVVVRFYVPDDGSRRAVLVIPGVHSMGIEEPRLAALAADLAGAGVTVMAMALPDLQAYRITPDATDVIEDAVAWMAQRPNLAPDGRVGIVGVSFAGGLSISAASRPFIRDKVAFVVSLGGHGDLPRVMRYLTTGEERPVPGLTLHRPHDYGVAVILYGLADRGVVPADQVAVLRRGIQTFLLASQLTLVDTTQANATFARAREMAAAMPEPSRTYMNYVNDRAVTKLGPVLVPYLHQFGADDPALSPDRVDDPTPAPIFLLHGDDDTVIPAAESAMLADDLRRKGADVHLLLSGLITHAEVSRNPSATDVWKLITFWKDVLDR